VGLEQLEVCVGPPLLGKWAPKRPIRMSTAELFFFSNIFKSKFDQNSITI
jgi:hypothetical protein